MGDPLSVASGIAGLLSLGIQVVENIRKFYACYKDLDTDVERATQQLETLLVALESLRNAIQSRQDLSKEDGLPNRIESSIQPCGELIEELQAEYQKLVHVPDRSLKQWIRTKGQRVAYPFRKSTLQKLDEDINDIRDNLAFALDILQLRGQDNLINEAEEIRSLLQRISSAQISGEIRDWLKAPDATTNHNAACALRHANTGLWFVRGDVFRVWLNQKNRFLWLSGFAGCGKTVLCSTAIQYTYRHKRSDPHIGIAIFYFTFSDESKQSEDAMLRALLFQLACQLPSDQSQMDGLYQSYKKGSPPTSALANCLRALIKQFDHVYVLIDALDECPRGDSRDRVLEMLSKIRDFPGVHLLVTARNEPDIRLYLDPTQSHELVLKNAEIDQDIRKYISGYLKSDLKLRKLEKHHEMIENALSERADGVFRWAQCQLQAVKSCKQSQRGLEKCLQSLPQSLDATYERILCSISEDLANDAKRLLTLLCYSSRPLTIYELIHGMAVDIEKPGLDFDDVIEDEECLREICPILVDFAHSYDQLNEIAEIRVRIAHFSVQEYLESTRILNQQAAAYALSKERAHAEIAKICCAYLLEPSLSNECFALTPQKFPLTIYATANWYYHYSLCMGDREQIQNLVFNLFQRKNFNFIDSMHLHRMELSWLETSKINGGSMVVRTPLLFASLLGLDLVFDKIISSYDPMLLGSFLSARIGDYGTVLQAVSSRGHESIVQRLLDHGADVDAQDGLYGTPLQQAPDRGYEPIVLKLLDHGADVNIQGGRYGTALRAASANGYEFIVQKLLDHGADVNAQGGRYGTALQAASARGYESIVQKLLDYGADVDAQGRFYGTALQAASAGGYESIVQKLLDNGADINTQACYGPPLRGVTQHDHDQVVQILLQKGAGVNAAGRRQNCTALQRALSQGHDVIVKKLLDNGAIVGSQEEYSSALQAVARGGYDRTLQKLLDEQVETNAADDGVYDAALQAALDRGHESIVQMLLARGARRADNLSQK